MKRRRAVDLLPLLESTLVEIVEDRALCGRGYSLRGRRRFRLARNRAGARVAFALGRQVLLRLLAVERPAASTVIRRAALARAVASLDEFLRLEPFPF